MSAELKPRRLWSGLSGISVAINVGAAVGGALITALVVLSAIMRYAVGSPFIWSDEVAGFMFFVFSFAALPISFLTRDHIRLTFLVDRMPPSARNYLNLATHLFATVLLGIFTKVAWDHAMLTYRLHSISVNAHIPIFPWQIMLPLLSGFCTVLVLAHTIGAVLALVSPRK